MAAPPTAHYSDQSAFSVRCEWGVSAIDCIAPADVIVIVDVLSFSTCVDIAVSRGAAVLPYRWKDDSAVAFAHKHDAVLASRRDRFSSGYSLSPSSLLAVPAGLRLVLPSPNGSTLAFKAYATGATVIAGCLRNASAVAAWVNRNTHSALVLSAGERWPDGSLRFALEDLLGAGAILSELSGILSPEAQAAAGAFTHARNALPRVLHECASGRELAERGFACDLELAATLNRSDTVPLLRDEAFVHA